jgi:hypothetical protein
VREAIASQRLHCVRTVHCCWRTGPHRKHCPGSAPRNKNAEPSPNHPVAGHAGSPRPSARAVCACVVNEILHAARLEAFSHNFTPINRCFSTHLHRTRAPSVRPSDIVAQLSCCPPPDPTLSPSPHHYNIVTH